MPADVKTLKEDLARRMDGALETLRREFAGLRTGRAHPGLLEPVKVIAYGQEMPLNQVGTIGAPEARMLTVQVWDKSMVSAVEKAIRDSGLGLNPAADGMLVRVPIPQLTTERRSELAKMAHKYAEGAKISVRGVRRDGMEQIKGHEKKHEIGEDLAKTWADEVQKLTDQYVKRSTTRSRIRKRTSGRSERPSLIGEHVDRNPTYRREANLQPGAAEPPPTHVAVIMDGNGRWAAARHLPRIAGHREGARAVRRTIEAAIAQGVSWLTIYAFSSENWRRPLDEVLDLTGLLRQYLRTEIAELKATGVRLRFIGDRCRFDTGIQGDLRDAERDTTLNTRLNLTIALSYGARAEIVEAARAAAEAVRAGTLDPAKLDEAVFAGFLATAEMPDPDLIIRTSGERRLSNFLLWQAAYAELVFQDVLWPDFGAEHFAAALAEYARRERRFGARPA